MKHKVVVGEYIGERLIVARTTPLGHKHPRYLVRCPCGSEKEICDSALYRTTCCIKCSTRKNNKARSIHGESKTRLYDVWARMILRCESPRRKEYRFYGARGIKVCAEWHDYRVFRDWALNHGYAKGLQLDRLNPRKDYEPGNCEWVTPSENSKRVHQSWRSEHTPIEMLWGHC